jgi:hypothetical protein
LLLFFRANLLSLFTSLLRRFLREGESYIVLPSSLLFRSVLTRSPSQAGYSVEGVPFLEDGADHIRMTKTIQLEAEA